MIRSYIKRKSWLKRGNSVLKRSSLKQKSFKKYLREEVGKAQLEYLRLVRKNEHICDICGKYRPFLSRFHILPVGNFPKLEFVDENVLLTDWLPCHSTWHHDYLKARDIRKRLEKLLGDDFEDRLIAISAMQPKQTEMILSCKLHWYKMEIEILKRTKV